jgi:hypothetical protein
VSEAMSLALVFLVATAVGVALMVDGKGGWQTFGGSLVIFLIALTFSGVLVRGRQIDKLRLRVIALEKAARAEAPK